jgi:heptosyltransferase-3
MTNLLMSLKPGSRVTVIRLRSLGDCVLTTPALALLKSFRPDLKITVVVEPRFAAVFEANPDVDHISSGEKLLSGGLKADLVLNLHGGTRSMFVTLASRARFRAGFAHHAWSMLYNVPIPRAQEILCSERTVHTAEHLASAMFYLGVPFQEIPRAKLVATAVPDLPPYAVIHPFASAPKKTWPAERFLAVAGLLRQKFGLEPVFLAGPGEKGDTFAQYRVWHNQPLDGVKNLISGAQLFVGNDSGPAHVAAAFGVPLVALFGASNPVVWSPWRTDARVLTSWSGIGNITVDQVLSALESHRPHRVKA